MNKKVTYLYKMIPSSLFIASWREASVPLGDKFDGAVTQRLG